MSTTNTDSPTGDLELESLYELCNLVDFITQSGSGASLSDIKLTDLYNYLRNPYKNLKNIRMASKYLTNKHGIVKDILRTMRTLLTLNYHLSWSSFDDVEKIKEYEKKVYDFLDNIDVKKLCRDVYYDVGESGTVVLCNRKNKYIQFLELDDVRINRQINGKWVVEYDLKSISGSAKTIEGIIESLPDEVTLAKYNEYKKKNTDEYRYVELDNCDVVSIDGNRNYPYGLPFHFGAWASLIQKEIINRVERSVSDRLIKQVLILYAGNIGGKDSNKPTPKPLIEHYFNQVSNLIQKKEQGANKNTSSDMSGTGVVALPSFFNLEALKVDVSMFTKDVYNKINTDIFMNLGVSPALIYGGGSDVNFATAQINSEKFFRFLYTILEDIERIINSYIQGILPKDLRCKFYFDRTTILDKDKFTDKCKEFYQQTGVWIPWAEALFQVPYHYILGMKQYQDKVLGVEDIIRPPLNAYTMSGNDVSAGRPSTENPTNSNTEKSQGSGGNTSPSPSD